MGYIHTAVQQRPAYLLLLVNRTDLIGLTLSWTGLDYLHNCKRDFFSFFTLDEGGQRTSADGTVCPSCNVTVVVSREW
jgi:hypothetical protein